MADAVPNTGAPAGAPPSSKTLSQGDRDTNFDPQRWLIEWEHAGGSFIIYAGHVWIGAKLVETKQVAQQRRLWSQLDAKPGRRVKVRECVQERWAR